MSEYSFVEKPFLEQLSALGWEVIEQSGIPRDPALSFRTDFKEILAIHTTDKHRQWQAMVD